MVLALNTQESLHLMKIQKHPNKPTLKKGAALNANYLSFEDQQAAKCARPLLMLSLQEDFMD